MPTRVALNALALRPGGSGVQTYIRELLGQLAVRSDVELVAAVQSDAVAELPAGVQPLVRRRADGVRRAVEGTRRLGPADLVHGLDVDLPLRPGAATVATIHDMAVFDVPWAFPRVRALGEQRLTRLSLRRADQVIVMSAFTAERVRALSGREATVIPLAPRTDLRPAGPEAVADVRRRYHLPDTFALHLGNIEPRKDVATLGAACREAALPLVLAGARVGNAGVPSGAQAIGYVEAADLAALYGAATVVCYPSRYEGFGLPPVEAMTCGAPVVASRIPPLQEVLGDGAELVAARDVTALAAALRGLVADHDRRRDLAERGQARAARYSWPSTAAATVDVYRRAGLVTAP